MMTIADEVRYLAYRLYIAGILEDFEDAEHGAALLLADAVEQGRVSPATHTASNTITVTREAGDGVLHALALHLGDVDVTLPADTKNPLGIGEGSRYVELGRAQALQLTRLLLHPKVTAWLAMGL